MPSSKALNSQSAPVESLGGSYGKTRITLRRLRFCRRKRRLLSDEAFAFVGVRISQVSILFLK